MMNQACDRSNSTSGALRAASALLFCAAAAALSFSESPAQVPPQGTTPDYDSALCEQLGGTLETSENEEVCSNLDANDTFCMIGSADAFPCRGLFKHVIKCNAEYNRPALNPFFCGEKCDEAFGENFPGKARGLRCERVISANAAVSVSFPSSPAATIYAPEGYAGAVGAADLSLGYTLNFINPPDAARFTIFESSGDFAVTLLPPGLLSPATLLLTAEIVCADCYPLDPLTLGAVFVPVVAPPQDLFNVDAGQPLTGVTFNLPALEDYPGLSNSVFTDADSGDGFAIDGAGLVTGTHPSASQQIIRGLWTADGMLGTLALALTLNPAAVLEFAPAALIIMEGPGNRFHNAGLALNHEPIRDATFRVSVISPSQDAVGAGDIIRFRFNGADAAVSDASFEITLAVGERGATLEFEVADDTVFETPEGFSLELERINGDGARAGAGAVRAVTLVDPISLAARMTVMENEGGATVTVTLGNDRPASNVTVGLLYGGAAGGDDYENAPAAVVISAGETSAEFDFGIIDDIIALEFIDTVTFQGGYADLRMSVDTIGFAGVQRDIYMNLPEARPGALMHIKDDDEVYMNLEMNENVSEGESAQGCVTYSGPFALDGNPGDLAVWVREWDGTGPAGNRLDTVRLRTKKLSDNELTDVLDFYEEGGAQIPYRHTPIILDSGRARGDSSDTQTCFDFLFAPIDDKPENTHYVVEFGARDPNTLPENLKLGDTVSSLTIHNVPPASFRVALFPSQSSSSPRVATVYAPKGHTGASDNILRVNDNYDYTLTFTPPGGTLFALSPSTSEAFGSSNDYAITLRSPGLLAPATLQLTAEFACPDCVTLQTTLQAVYIPVSAPPQTAYGFTSGTALSTVTFDLPSLNDYPGLSRPSFRDAGDRGNFDVSVSYDWNGSAYVANVTGTPTGVGPITVRGLWTASGMVGALTLALTLKPAAVLEFAPAALIAMEGPGARFHNAGLALSHSPPADATFRVSVSFPSQDAAGMGDITRFRFNGADAVVSDASFEITLAVGERGATLEFEIVDDEVFETPEGFSLELELINGDGARAGANAVRAVTLVDPISLAARMTVMENEGRATVTVTLGNDRPASDVTVGLLYGGAADGGDYSGAPASVVITAGETSAEFDFGIIDDIIALEHLDPVTFQGGYADLRMSVDTVGFAGVQRDIYMNLPEARPEAVIHIADDDTLVLNIELSERAAEGSGTAQGCVTYSNPFALSGTPGGLALWMIEWDGTLIQNPDVTYEDLRAPANSFGDRIDTLRLSNGESGAGVPTDVLDSYEEKDGGTIQYRHTRFIMKPGATQTCFDLILPPIDNKSEDQYYGWELGSRNPATLPPKLILQNVRSNFTIYDVPVASFRVANFPFQSSRTPRVATVYAPKGHTGASDNILRVNDDYDYTLTFTPPGETLFALSPSTSDAFGSSNDYAITLHSPGLLAPATLQLTAEFACAVCVTLSTTLQAVYIPLSAPPQPPYRFTSGTPLSGVTFNLPSRNDYPGFSRIKFRDAGDRGNFDVSVSYEWDGSAGGAYVTEVTGTPTGNSPITVRGLWTATGMVGTLTLELTLTPPDTAAANPERENAVPPSADFSAVLCGADNCQNALVSFPSSGHFVSFPSSAWECVPRSSASHSRPAGAAAPEPPPYSFRRRFKGGSFAARAKPAAPAPRKTATAPKTSPKAAAHCGDHASSKTCSTAA